MRGKLITESIFKDIKSATDGGLKTSVIIRLFGVSSNTVNRISRASDYTEYMHQHDKYRKESHTIALPIQAPAFNEDKLDRIITLLEKLVDLWGAPHTDEPIRRGIFGKVK